MSYRSTAIKTTFDRRPRRVVLLISAIALVCSFSSVSLAKTYSTLNIATFGAKIQNTAPTDSDDYLAYNSPTPANIYYRVHPVTTKVDFRPRSVKLYIKHGSSTVRIVSLPAKAGDGLTTWNGKNSAGSPVNPGVYTATVEVTALNKKVTSDPHNITVVKVEINKPVQVTRGQSGAITATLSPSGLTPNKVEWVFIGGRGGTKNTTPNLSTSVILIDGDNSYAVRCKVTIASAVAEDIVNITVNSRTGASWEITPTCATDNEANWGNFPGVPVALGQFRDRDSKTSRIVTPADGGFICTQVDDPNGPNDDYWYIQSTTLKIDMETVINKYTKSGTTPPTPPGTNWHEYNESHSVDADGLLVGLRGHEYMGKAGNEGKGHFAFLKDKEDDAGMDARTEIEDNWDATSKTVLEEATEIEKDDINSALYSATAVEPSGNWGPATVYYYDFSTSGWKTTTYGN